MTFYEARQEAFAAMAGADMYGDSFTLAKSATHFDCITNATAVMKRMQENNYQEEIPVNFTVKVDDKFNLAKIQLKDRINYSGHVFEIFAIVTKPNEPTAILRTNRKQ